MIKTKLLVSVLAVMLCMTALPVVAYAGGGEETTPTPPPESTLETPRPENPFTPEGSGEVMDNATSEDGKEFFTITTKDGNVFYLIIDRQRKTQNVYFLGTVDEIDLLALAEKNEQGKTGIPAVSEPTPPPAPTPDPQPTDPTLDPETPEKSGGTGGMLIMIVVIAAVGGGAFYFFKIRKPKQSVKGSTDLDEYDFEDDEDEPVNEDDTKPEREDE